MRRCWSSYYIRTGGNFRALDLILRNVPREGQKGADAVIKQVEQWYKERVEPIEKELDDQEVKDYLLKVAEAGPMGYLPESDEETEMKLKLLGEDEENIQFKRGFEALAFRRQALSRGWAEVEGCRIHVSFAVERKLWRLRCFVGESSKSNFHILHA